MSDAEAEDTPSSTQSVPVVVPMRRTGNRRMSEVVDIETGKQGGARLQHALVGASSRLAAASARSHSLSDSAFQLHGSLLARKSSSRVLSAQFRALSAKTGQHNRRRCRSFQ